MTVKLPLKSATDAHYSPLGASSAQWTTDVKKVLRKIAKTAKISNDGTFCTLIERALRDAWSVWNRRKGEQRLPDRIIGSEVQQELSRLSTAIEDARSAMNKLGREIETWIGDEPSTQRQRQAAVALLSSSAPHYSKDVDAFRSLLLDAGPLFERLESPIAKSFLLASKTFPNRGARSGVTRRYSLQLSQFLKILSVTTKQLGGRLTLSAENGTGSALEALALIMPLFPPGDEIDRPSLQTLAKHWSESRK